MRTYVTGWSIVASALTGLSAVVAVEQAGWAATLIVILGVMVLAGTLAYVWSASFGPGAVSVPGWTVGSGAGVLLFVGLPLALGRGGLAVLVLLAATAPSAVRLLGRHLFRPAPSADWQPPAPPRAVEPPTTRPRPLSPMSDPRLSPAWLDTERRMRTADFEETLEIVAERERLLDEFEERDPEGFHAWLASSPPRSA